MEAPVAPLDPFAPLPRLQGRADVVFDVDVVHIAAAVDGG
jgi:hypothetical protein